MNCPNCGGDLGRGYSGECCHLCGDQVSEDSPKSVEACAGEDIGVVATEEDEVGGEAPLKLSGVKETMLGFPVANLDSGSAESISEALSRASGEREPSDTTLGIPVVELPKVIVEVEIVGVEESSESGVSAGDDFKPEPEVRVVEDREEGDNSEVVERKKSRSRDAPDTTASDSIDYKWAQKGRKWTVAVVLILLALSLFFMFWWSYIRPY